MESWEDFYRLLQKQEGYYRVILEIVKAEKDKLQAACSLSEIKKLVKKRKILMACIQEVDDDMVLYKQRWKMADNQFELSFAQEVNSQLGHLSRLIKEILDEDVQNQTLLKESLKELQLKKVQISSSHQ